MNETTGSKERGTGRREGPAENRREVQGDKENDNDNEDENSFGSLREKSFKIY